MALLRHFLNQTLQKTGIRPDPLAPSSVRTIRSAALNRKVRVDLYLPPSHKLFLQEGRKFPVVFFNDGQDLHAMRFKAILSHLVLRRQIGPVLAVGFHAGNRMQEYGVMHHPDYKNRGNRADAYARFIVEEFLPRLKKDFPIETSPEHHAFAGFSLGGLSAFDLVWNHPHLFGKVGVFSGALWWRSKPFTQEEPDANRILHHLVRTGEKRPGLKFWFQTGTEDETMDRNKNGVIDAIDDTLDLIRELKEIGYAEEDIAYVEVEGGRHEPETWGRVMPEFLKWAFSDGVT